MELEPHLTGKDWRSASTRHHNFRIGHSSSRTTSSAAAAMGTTRATSSCCAGPRIWYGISRRSGRREQDAERVPPTNAGRDPWPKLFQNLRASRATELARHHPGHVAAAWLGHSTTVASRHYWQVTEEDFDRALHSCVQQPAGDGREQAQQAGGPSIIPLDCASLHDCTSVSVAEAGVEPARGLPPNGF